MKTSTDKFLFKLGMHHEQFNYKRIQLELSAKAKAKLSGEDSSLMMIPSYIDITKPTVADRNVVAIDAGGTHLRIAQITIDKNGIPQLIRQEKFLMQEISSQHTTKSFFEKLCDVLIPHLSFSKDIGISFAYPGYITETKDMIIESMCKEVVIDDIGGKSLREGIQIELKCRGIVDVKISVINDTVASLLGASGIEKLREYGACVGLILGTGMNTCLKMDLNNTGKEKKIDIINSESGMFYIKGGLVDDEIDNESQLPKDHCLEKMISGKYLPRIVEKCIIKAYEEKLIGEGAKNKYTTLDGTTLSTILSSRAANADEEFIKLITENAEKRAVKLIAANIAAWVLLYKSEKPALITTEGSTVNKLYGFKEALDDELKNILLYENSIEYDIISVDDAVVKGAAVSALL